MISTVTNINEFYEKLDGLGLRDAIEQNSMVAVKLNFSDPVPAYNHPGSDPRLIRMIAAYVKDRGGVCIFTEGAFGRLKSNFIDSGLGDLTDDPSVKIVDVDDETIEVSQVEINGELHYIPCFLQQCSARIALPSATKRKNRIFSNNTKTFVGVVPCRMYQIGENVPWRPRIHLDLHRSVANLYLAIQKHAPFHFYINGGTAYDEEKGSFEIDRIFMGDDAVELDLLVLERYFNADLPEYLRLLR